MGDIENQGLDTLTEYPQGDLVMFRSFGHLHPRREHFGEISKIWYLAH